MDVREKTTSKNRLIDADALLNEFLKRYTERERNRNLVFAVCEIKQDFADMISDFQTVDAVEVVQFNVLKSLVNGEWVDCKLVQEALGIGFGTGLKITVRVAKVW